VKEIKNSYLPLDKTPPIVLQWKGIKEDATHQVNQAMSIRVCNETESPSPDGLWDSGGNMVVRCTQDVESKNHPTPTSEQNQTVPLKQVKVPNRMSSRQKKIPLTKSEDFLW
jgi:hypothetical protein